MGKNGPGVAVPGELAREIRDVRARHRARQVLDAAVRLLRDGSFEVVSMHALAREAGVSVGLIYSYVGGKEDVVVAVVLDLVDRLADETERRMTAAGPDPVERLAAGFAAYCTVMDTHRIGGLLTYRQSGELGPAARARIKDAELGQLAPMHDAARAAVRDGTFVAGTDTDVLVFDLMILAQAWALKHWHFGADYDVARYVRAQTAVVLCSALAPEHTDRYRHLTRP